MKVYENAGKIQHIIQFECILMKMKLLTRLPQMPNLFLRTGWQQQNLEFESINSCTEEWFLVAFLQLETVWQEMVWELLENTQLIGFGSEQKLNSLTWPLYSLAGALQTHPFLVELESANCSADRKEDPRARFQGSELSTAACFFPPICSHIFHHSQEVNASILLSQDSQPSSGLLSKVCRRRQVWVQECQIWQLPVLFPDRFPTFPRFPGWVYIEYFTIP